MSTAFITHPACLKHEMIDGHPERPGRLGAIEDRLRAAGLHDLLRHYEAPRASRGQLTTCHEPDYVRRILSAAPGEGLVHMDPDTSMNRYSAEAARHAAGAGILAVDLVMKGEVRNAFCCVRPPGHHAEHDRAMGFCFFNNAAIAARHALLDWGLERIAVVDFDVHYGNGTDDIFRDEPRVMLLSTYQVPLYPFMDPPSRPGHLINAPLPPAAGGRVFREAVSTHLVPALEEFRPELVVISAGFDAHVEDELGGIGLTESDYAWVTRELVDIADRHARGRIVSTLEGGYAFHALGRSAAEHVRVLMGV